MFTPLAHFSHATTRVSCVSSTSDERMAHIPFRLLPMEQRAAAAPTGGLPSPLPATTANGGVVYCGGPALHASVMRLGRQPAAPTAAEAARQRQQEEGTGIRLVHLLVTCAGAIQAGDYPAAHNHLTEARATLAAIATSTGIGRVAKHFSDALAQRLFPAYPQPAAAAAAPPASPAAAPAELYDHFNDAGPYLRFAFSTANQAILDAFQGCDSVHVVDLALMRGLQWPGLIRALSNRHGGPPFLRITGIGGAGEELSEVGARLEQFARSLNVPFSFREVRVDQLDGLRKWMLGVVPGEALAVNSVLQLHRLLVDPDADPAVPAPIDAVLRLVTSLRPRVFTVVEQEADHNRPALLERFTNALFHYASMFDSMAAASRRTGGGSGALAEASPRAEIVDIVCGEGTARAERHEPLVRWRERLARAGLAQVPFGPDEVCLATAELIRATMFSGGSGYGILECAGSLALAWHDRPLYAATAWRAAGGVVVVAAAAAVADNNWRDRGRRRKSRNGSGESNGRGNPAVAYRARAHS